MVDKLVGEKVKILLDKDVVLSMIKLKTNIGDTYSKVIRRLLDSNLDK